MPVYHEHNSPKEIQSIQMVDGDHMNRSIMCTTCMDVHPVVSDPVLNICVGTGQLHNIHTPRTSWSSESRMPPDPIHIDWVTVCRATIIEIGEGMAVGLQIREEAYENPYLCRYRRYCQGQI